MQLTKSIALLCFASVITDSDARADKPSETTLLGNRFLTLNSIVRVSHLADKEGIHVCQGSNWSLICRINQKGARPQDEPLALSELTDEKQAPIRRHYPDLFEIRE